MHGEVVPVRELKTAYRGIPYNLCYLRLAPAQGSDPKKVRSAPAQAPTFWLYAQGSDPRESAIRAWKRPKDPKDQKDPKDPRATDHDHGHGKGTRDTNGQRAKRQRNKEWKTRMKEERAHPRLKFGKKSSNDFDSFCSSNHASWFLSVWHNSSQSGMNHSGSWHKGCSSALTIPEVFESSAKELSY